MRNPVVTVEPNSLAVSWGFTPGERAQWQGPTQDTEVFTLIDHDFGDPGPFEVGDRVRVHTDIRCGAPGVGTLGTVASRQHTHPREIRWYTVQVDGKGKFGYREDTLSKISAKRYPPVSTERTPANTPVPIAPKPLTAIGRASNANARAKGFYAELEFAREILGADVAEGNRHARRILTLIEKLWIGTRLALIHSEVSEMLEAHRDGDMGMRIDAKGKPEGFDAEAADVVIRLTDLVVSMGGDLDAAVSKKAAYNATRPALHGKVSGL